MPKLTPEQDEIRARFVGGPKHNQLILVQRLPCIRVFAPKVPQTTFEIRSASPYSFEPVLTETYFLVRFRTEFDTPFWQYVHESLMNNIEPHVSTYQESFPKFTLCL